MLLAAAFLSFTIHDVTVIDVINGRAGSPQSVFVTNGRIVPAPGKDAVEVDGSGKFLIPGLWDMHVHVRGGKDALPDNEAFLKLFIANGVTTVREMGGDLNEALFLWRKEIERGDRLGPRIFTSGPKLDGPKPAWPGSIPVVTPQEGRQAVKQVHQMGADLVKLYFDFIEPATLKAITAEARKLHLTVAGHNARNLTVREFVEAGVRDIQHMQYYVTPGCSTAESAVTQEFAQRRTMTMDEWTRRMLEDCTEERTEDLIRFLAKHKVWITPTLARVEAGLTVGVQDYEQDPRRKYILPAIWKSWDPNTGRRKPLSESARVLRQNMNRKAMELTPRLHAAGVHILAGSDCGASNNYSFPGWTLHEELEALVRAGFTPGQALQTATIDAARFFHLENDTGSITRNKKADLVLLNANPLEDIRNTQKIAGVLVQGRWLDRMMLDDLLAEVAAAAGR